MFREGVLHEEKHCKIFFFLNLCLGGFVCLFNCYFVF